MSVEGRLIVVSNRLPVTIERSPDGEVELRPGADGLPAGLSAPPGRSVSRWVGWPGPLEGFDPASRAALQRLLEAERFLAVDLSKEEVKGFNEGFANGVLWPAFHYHLQSLPPVASDWEAYRKVNQKFVDRISGLVREGDRVWIHDYELMLVPAMLRRRFARARIGFFLHIPFPSPEVFRVLPHREELLRGVLGADLVGFHTLSSQRHFLSTVSCVLGLPVDAEQIAVDGRRVRAGVFPISIERLACSRGKQPAAPVDLEALLEEPPSW